MGFGTVSKISHSQSIAMDLRIVANSVAIRYCLLNLLVSCQLNANLLS